MLQDCVSIEAIKAGKKHLNAPFTAITSIQSNKEETHFLAKKRPASTAHMETHFDFLLLRKSVMSSLVSHPVL